MNEITDRILQLERAARPLEPGTADRERLRAAVVASSERFLQDIETLQGYGGSENERIRLLDVPIAEHGIPIEAAIELLERDVFRPGSNPASGGHLAFIPGSAIYHAALGDYLAAIVNKHSGFFFSGPGPVRMENMLVRWADEINQEIVDAVRRDGRVFLSSTLIDGRFTLRMAALSFRTHLRTIDLALRILREQVAALTLVDAPGGQE